MALSHLETQDEDILALIGLLQAGKIQRWTLKQFISTFASDNLHMKERSKERMVYERSQEPSPKSPNVKPKFPRVTLIDISQDLGLISRKMSPEKKSEKRSISPIARPAKRIKPPSFVSSDSSEPSDFSDFHGAKSYRSRLKTSKNDSSMIRCDVTVVGVLEKYETGSALICNYAESGELGNEERRTLVKIITTELIATNFLIERNSEFERLAREIYEIFPTERMSTYYVKPCGANSSWDGKSKRSRGLLVNKFRFEVQKYKRSFNVIERNKKTATRAGTKTEVIMKQKLQARMKVNHPELAYLQLCCLQNCCTNLNDRLDVELSSPGD